METKNNNKGLIAIIIILTIITLSLTAYLFYSKTNEENLQNDNEKIENNEKLENQNITNISSVFEKFYGKWEYSYKYEDLDCEDYHKLELKKDGTYTYSSGSTCAGAWDAKGKYAISQNKIYLYNDNCKISLVDDVCTYPNCSKIEELDYTEKNGEIHISVGTVKLEKK